MYLRVLCYDGIQIIINNLLLSIINNYRKAFYRSKRLIQFVTFIAVVQIGLRYKNIFNF